MKRAILNLIIVLFLTSCNFSLSQSTNIPLITPLNEVEVHAPVNNYQTKFDFGVMEKIGRKVCAEGDAQTLYEMTSSMQINMPPKSCIWVTSGALISDIIPQSIAGVVRIGSYPPEVQLPEWILAVKLPWVRLSDSIYNAGIEAGFLDFDQTILTIESPKNSEYKVVVACWRQRNLDDQGRQLTTVHMHVLYEGERSLEFQGDEWQGHILLLENPTDISLAEEFCLQWIAAHGVKELPQALLKLDFPVGIDPRYIGIPEVIDQ